MKVLMISGSRDKEGQTARAGRAVLDGAISRGAEVEEIFLVNKKMEHCKQCDKDGWGKCAKEGMCCLKDDFAEVLGKIKACDAVVFATPVYLWEPSESFMAFATRLRRVCFEWGKFQSVDKKPAVVIAVAGGGGTGSIRTIFQIEQLLDFSGFTLVDLWPVQRQNLKAKIPQMRLAGEWLAEGHKED